jgi:hypothetical protein
MTIMNARKAGGTTDYLLTASGLEFYMMLGFDLLNDHTYVERESDHQVRKRKMTCPLSSLILH